MTRLCFESAPSAYRAPRLTAVVLLGCVDRLGATAGACEGSLACSTCHVIVESDEYYSRMKEPCEDELDMLDLAFGLTAT